MLIVLSYAHSVKLLFFQKQRLLATGTCSAQTKSAPNPLQNTLHGKRASLFSREDIFAESEFEIFSREYLFANVGLLFT